MNKGAATPGEAQQPVEKFGTFLGVFTPSVLTILGLMEPEPGAESEYADRLNNMVEGLKTTIFVRSAGKFAGRLV